jgi:hypothetical protein
MGATWERHGMCELVFKVPGLSLAKYLVLNLTLVFLSAEDFPDVVLDPPGEFKSRLYKQKTLSFQILNQST